MAKETVPQRDATDGNPKFVQCWWGEYLYATKEQIQALGIGVGQLFPGEVGGPKRRLKTIDPRGFETRIETSSEGFCVHIEFFPDRDKNQGMPGMIEYAPGVTKQESRWCDCYTGTSDSLIAAGLVKAEQLPGYPGQNKTCVSVFADGSIQRHRTSYEPGAKSIQKV